MPELRTCRNILALISLDDSDEKVLESAVSQARMHGAHLELLHIIEIESSGDGGYPAPSPAEAARACEAAALRKMQILAARRDARIEHCHVRFGAERIAFNAFTRDYAPEMVVVPRKKASLVAGPWEVLVATNATVPLIGRLRAVLHGWSPAQPIPERG